MLDIIEVRCPYCGEPLELAVDPSVAEQDYVEDCEVCCRPMRVLVNLTGEGFPRVRVQREDE